VSATIGFEFKVLKERVGGAEVELKIWDTAGQEKFRNIVVGQFKGKQGVFMVFDLTKEESLRNSKFWLRHIKSHVNDPKLVTILLGNKCDITDAPRVRNEAIADFVN
jgi:small GTP-binding protein